jgi:Domain of unknown function (DUF4388)
MDTHKAKVGFTRRGASSASGQSPGLDYHPDQTPDGIRSAAAGFAGTCQTTLTDWIQLVQMGRRDAVVSVRTHDGKEGTLWCRDGDIIDAVCDGLVGEEAVYQALSWQGGRVSVEFQGFKHRRQILTPTAGLLLTAAYRTDSAVLGTGQPQVAQLQDVSGPFPPDVADAGAGTALLLSPRWTLPHRHRRVIWLVAAAVGLLLVGLLSGVVPRWMSSRGPRHPMATAAAAAAAVSVRPDEDWARPAIRRDGKPDVKPIGDPIDLRPGVGKLAWAPLEKLGGAPPHRRVLTVRAKRTVGSPAFERSRETPAGVQTANGQKNRPRDTAPANLQTPAHVQIIEARQPSVRIIDDRKPDIDVIQ